jgi:GAF domain-containing protein
MFPDYETPLVPLLLPGEESADAETLETWYLALSNAVSSDLPHDLLAVWVYPASGGVALIAPAALAADQLTVPAPPDISPAALGLLEEIIRDAGYPSVMAEVIRLDDRATGLILFAALRDDTYGEPERAMAAGVAAHLAPMFNRLARRWGQPDEAVPPEETGSSVVAAVARMIGTTDNPRAFALALRETLAPFLAADRLEILVPGTSPEQWYRLSEHPGGPLWSDPDLIVNRSRLDVPALFGVNDSVLLADAGPDAAVMPAPVRAVAGVWLTTGGRATGALLVGSTEPGRYGEGDIRLLADVAALVGIRVESFVAAGNLQVVRSHLATLRAVPAHLGRLAEMLATTTDSAEATRRFAAEAMGLLSFERLHFALRLAEEDRVAVVAPGEARALPDLPLTPVAGTGLGRVVRGELANLLVRTEQRTDLIVGLRVGGRVIGAMVLTGDASRFGRGDVETAQQLADLVAPHLELLRRVAVAPPPMMPGWKRAPRF